MGTNDTKKTWEEYRTRELSAVIPVLAKLGFTLESDQSHLGGERYLMHAVTTESGRKLILLARMSNGKRVVIKVTRDPNGVRELVHERICRAALKNIDFAYHIFFSPEEILFTKQNGYTISIQEFIEQDRPFLERPTEDQFSLILRSFKAQEGSHATTYAHRRFALKTFGDMNGENYLNSYRTFQKNISNHPLIPETVYTVLQKGESVLKKHMETIEQYSGFLTHTDFVPHNFRIVGDRVYLLDHSSLRFGNKHEGWARFLNFMTLYNRPLEEALLFYVRNNRAEEEMLSLKLMRIYRLGELIWYHTDKLEKTSGDLYTLTQKRVTFWTSVLEAILRDEIVSEEIVRGYAKARDVLRSPEERERQRGLH